MKKIAFYLLCLSFTALWSCNKDSDNSIPLRAIVVTPESISLEIGKTIRIKATPEPSDATDVSFSWESADEAIATVNAKGIVSGKEKGTTIVTVKSGDIKKEIPVTVTHSLNITIGSTTYKIDLVETDDSGTQAGAAAAAKSLVSANVSAVIGSFASAGERAALSHGGRTGTSLWCRSQYWP